jgi:lysophospholipase L1-like esterase
MRVTVSLWCVGLLLSAAGPAPAEDALPAARAAILKTLPLLQRSQATYARERTCFSCHHQALPTLALALARERGLPVDRAAAHAQAVFTRKSFADHVADYRKGTGIPGGPYHAGYALVDLATGAWPADEVTDALVQYLLKTQEDDGQWRNGSHRPPLEGSEFTATALAVRGLRLFARPAQQKEVAQRVERARVWLVKAKPADQEDRVFRLLGLKWAGADDPAVRGAAEALLHQQRDDGGWSQTADLASDAYATGQALVALHQAGGLAVSDPVYRRGVRFLLASQKEDGSWLVVSRSHPFQTYFESGFPHKKNQWISISATSWATMALTLLQAPRAAEGPVLDTMDTLRFHAPAEKARAELVEGKDGKAVRFSFDRDARGAFCTSNLHGTPAWDEAAGLSFWVKGDGSDHLGGVELIYDDDYAVRYDAAFPLKSREWTKIVIPWRDLVPVLPGPKSKPLDPHSGNRPSKITGLWFGKWWYWGDYPAVSFAIDDLRLEPTINLDPNDRRPPGAPLERVLAKLRAGKPVTIVTMGDSLTDYRHWANRQVSWPKLLQKQLEEEYKAKVTIINPAIGGTQLRQNLVLISRWQEQAPEPDLVTLCFGGNDWEAGMRGEQFRASYRDAVDRIRRATKGKADVLILTTVPSAASWRTTAELAEACRQAAHDENAGLADAAKAFMSAGKVNKERLYVVDRTHLSPAGHALLAKTVQEAIEAAGR